MKKFHSHLVVIQPTPFCNINCDYCYLPDRGKSIKVQENVLAEIFSQVFSSKNIKNSIVFLWHAGEPLTVPISFYENAFEMARTISKGEKNYEHAIQTNGTLLNPNWIDFIIKHSINVGVSLDGPDFIHDRYRKDRKGRGTYHKTLRGIKLLQEAKIPFSIIAVLTKFALDYPHEIYNLFVSNNIEEVGFNIDEIENINRYSSYQENNAMEKYVNFMKVFLKLVESGSKKLIVREFAKTYQKIFDTNKKISTINATNTPYEVLTFDYKGNYSTFCPELRGTRSKRFNDFLMGNVLVDNSLDNMTDNTVFKLVKEEINLGVKNCQTTCEYFDVCGGGTAANKFFEKGRFDVTETLACLVHKKTLTDIILQHFEEKLLSSN